MLTDSAERVLPPSGTHCSHETMFLVRRGGIPFDAVDALATPAAFAAVRALRAAIAEFRSDCDELARVVGDELIPDADDELTRRLINVRRVLREHRIPTDERMAAVQGLGGLVDGVERLRMRRDVIDARRAALPAILAADQSVFGERLAALASSSPLRHGMMLQSAALEQSLEALRRPDAKLSASYRRRLEASVLKYAYRAGAKTSPFSTLGVVGVGRVNDLAQMPRSGIALRTGETLRAVSQANLNTVARMVDHVLRSDELLEDIPLSVNASLESERARMRFIRRVRTTGAGKFDMGRVTEDVFFLDRTHVADGVLDETPGGIPFRDIARGIAERESIEMSAAREYVRNLIRIGLLVSPVFAIDLHDPAPLDSLAVRLAAIRRPWATDLADGLTSLAAEAGAFALEPTEERAARLTAVRARADDLLRGFSDDGGTSENVVFEDVADLAMKATIDSGEWREISGDLRVWSGVLAAYDAALPSRMSLAAYVRARYGEDPSVDDITRFVHEFAQDCYDQLQQAIMAHRDFDADGRQAAIPNWFRLSAFRAIDATKRGVRDDVQRAFDAAPGAEEIVLDSDRIAALAAGVPLPVGDENPRSFFLQPYRREGRARVVVNKSYSARGLHFSRFARLLDGEQPVVEHVRSRNGRDERRVFAELRGGIDTANLNLHPHLTDFELVCPGEVSFRPPEERIDLDELSVRLVDGSAVLWSERLGAIVVPVYLGYLMPFALPEVQRVLLLFSDTNMAMPDLWAGVDTRRAAVLPRIVFGDLVLCRRAWRVRRDDYPATTARVTDAERYAELVGWAEERGLPRRFFLQPSSGSSDDGGDGEKRFETKPLFVDLESEPSLRLFDRAVALRSGDIELQEMLPDASALAVDERTGDRFVVELTVDIDSREGEPVG